MNRDVVDLGPDPARLQRRHHLGAAATGGLEVDQDAHQVQRGVDHGGRWAIRTAGASGASAAS